MKWSVGHMPLSYVPATMTDSLYCLIVRISELLENTLHIHPNPTDGRIEVRAEQPISTIEVYNTIGQVLWNQKMDHVSGTIPFDISFLPRGLYFVRISAGERTLVKKIFKQ